MKPISTKSKLIYNKAFTLVEILIVLIIFGILSGVMFRTYSKISDISFRTQREKNLNQELVYISQTLQNISDNYTIDFEKYDKNNQETSSLEKNKGITDTLYLTGKTENTDYETIALYSTGTCVHSPTRIVDQDDSKGCWLEMKVQPRSVEGEQQLEKRVALTNTGKILFTPIVFKVVPYNSPENYYNRAEDIQNNGALAEYIGSNGFWILTIAYIPYYREDKWTNKVKILVQNFFNN